VLVSEALVVEVVFDGGLALKIDLIRSSIKDSISVTLYISVILTNSIVAVTASSGTSSSKMTRLRYNHYTSNWKLRVETTLSFSVRFADYSTPS
jgi:hypothetical protein